MAMDKVTIARIETILLECVTNAIKRTAKNIQHKPFHEALLTKELNAAAAFERSFSTSFGQRPIEEISREIALSTGAEAVRQKETMVNINKGAQDEITRILNRLRAGESTPNWSSEINKISAFKKGDYIAERIISDLWVKKEGKEYFFSLKTVKPNLDQTQIAKKDMLLIKGHNPEYYPFFVLYYNPGGEEKKEYNWSIPNKLFNIIKDDCVLIGKEYWDLIGGEGTYSSLLETFQKVGLKTRDMLKNLIT